MDDFTDILANQSMLDAFLADPGMQELWFDGASLAQLQEKLRGARPPALPEEPALSRVSFPDSDKGEPVALTVSPDGMTAWIQLNAPACKRDAVWLAGRLREALCDGGIVCGIRQKQLDRLAKEPIFGRPLLAAQGRQPRGAVDDVLKLHFSNGLGLAPDPEKPYGVDPARPDFTSMVHPGELLCVCCPPPGDSSGRNVYGQRIPSRAETMSRIIPGENVSATPDGLRLFARRDGEALLQNGVLRVLPVLRLDEVTPASGGVRFLGSVYVSGAVRPGSRIEAGGNVVVGGVAEDCAILAEGHLAVGVGVKGGDRCLLRVGGNLRTPFLEGVEAEIHGDLYADVAMSSEVRCEGAARLLGRRGRVIGGSLAAREIGARQLGSSAGAHTALEIPSLQPEFDRLGKLGGDIADWDKRIKNMSRLVGQASPERKAALERLLAKANGTRAETEKEIDRLWEKIRAVQEDHRPEIRVLDTVYSNVSCRIQDAVWNCMDDRGGGCRVFFGKNGVTAGPLPRGGA